MTDLPILDNHFHLDTNGRCTQAVRDFKKAGGTHLILVSKPFFKNHREAYQETLKLAKLAEKEDVKVFTVLGVHPAEITRGKDLEQTIETMKKGLEQAARLIEQGKAIALKSGRPHYPVPKEIWEASNQIMEHSFTLAREIDCPVQLHTETTTQETLTEIAKRARKNNLDPQKIIKHHSPPLIQTCQETGIQPSILANTKNIETALHQGNRFLLETDYIDDPSRPGAVLGPKTVPKKTKKLIQKYGEEPFWKIHKENPEKIYKIEIETK